MLVTIEKELGGYFQQLHFWNRCVPLIKMHCRVQYLFDFDFKIRSGQVCKSCSEKLKSIFFLPWAAQTEWSKIWLIYQLYIKLGSPPLQKGTTVFKNRLTLNPGIFTEVQIRDSKWGRLFCTVHCLIRSLVFNICFFTPFKASK